MLCRPIPECGKWEGHIVMATGGHVLYIYHVVTFQVGITNCDVTLLRPRPFIINWYVFLLLID